MPAQRAGGRSRPRYARLLIVGCVALLGTGGSAAGSDDAPPSLGERFRRRIERSLESRCLTPAVDGAFQQVVENGAMQRALGDGFTLTGGSAHDGRIDLTIEDAGSQSYSVTLAQQAIPGRTAASYKGAFVLYLNPSATDRADVSTALLAAATVLAEAIPDSAFAPCGERADTFGSRAVFLPSAGAEVLIVLAAVAFGLRALRDPADSR